MRRDDRQGIFHEDHRVNEHTHRHEEDGTEEVLHRLNEFFNTLSLNGLGQDATHDECTKRRREAYLGRKHCHGAAQTQRDDEQHLAVNQVTHLAQKLRDGKNAYHQP